MDKGCGTCKYYEFSDDAQEWQCWKDNCFYEGCEREELDLCDKYEME